MTWLPWLVVCIALLVIASFGLSVFGARHWAHVTRPLYAALEAGCTQERAAAPARVAAHFDFSELEGLPDPVQRYFRTALRQGQPMITAASIGLAGTFNLSATGEQWRRFTSRQRVVVHRPGFLWDARVNMLPGVAVRVYDGYINGEGQLRAAVLGLFTVADLHGAGEVARGELMRHFAEMPWYPTALLPSQGVRWQAVDAHAADATLVDGAITLTLHFRFNGGGLIELIRADARGAGVGKRMVMLPWEGRWSDYQPREGMMVPTKGEAAWLRPERRRPYFKGEVTALSYTYAG